MSTLQKTLPLPGDDTTPSKPDEPAVNLIREKVAHLYEEEPALEAEEAEIENLGAYSKHQKYIEQLLNSGQDMAQIQTAWHNYYQSLSDQDKYQVWQEFYANNQRGSKYLSKSAKPFKAPTHAQHQPAKQVIGSFNLKTNEDAEDDKATAANLKKQILNTISSRGKLSKKHHIHSLLFGLSMGVVVVVILMFGFFNERFIAPFITPSRTLSSTSIIVDPSGDNIVGPEPMVIIPKINVEVPVVYDVTSIDNKAIADGLLRGVLHYPYSPNPGQNGNVVVVGHSSNNIFNKGKYKFAFVLLSRLQVGDTFMLNYNKKQYIYKVYEKKIVKPTDVSVLGPTDKASTATLITCDPPGTAMNRLVVIGEQISPDINNNIAANPNPINEQPTIVPGNSESLFHRLFSWIWD